GNQGTSAKFTDFVAATTMSNTGAIITGSVALGAADRPLDYTVLDGKSYMAVVNTNSSLISIYDVTTPSAASLVITGSTVSGSLTVNVNATGGLQWGEVLSPTSQVLYAMSTNQGIQAMVFQAVPEPSTYAVMAGAFAVIGLVASRKRRSSDE
ncbi:MAG: PEP-CTERM sorting domain-containing protein, partial [Planctomycetaceae bacterium]